MFGTNCLRTDQFLWLFSAKQGAGQRPYLPRLPIVTHSLIHCQIILLLLLLLLFLSTTIHDQNRMLPNEVDRVAYPKSFSNITPHQTPSHCSRCPNLPGTIHLVCFPGWWWWCWLCGLVGGVMLITLNGGGVCCCCYGCCWWRWHDDQCPPPSIAQWPNGSTSILDTQQE